MLLVKAVNSCVRSCEWSEFNCLVFGRSIYRRVRQLNVLPENGGIDEQIRL